MQIEMEILRMEVILINNKQKSKFNQKIDEIAMLQLA